MMITQRQKYILDLVVKNYLQRGTPASSFSLKKTYRLPFSSPTIRNELKALEEMELLEKPFFSSGRFPTTKALNYYLENFICSRWRIFARTYETLTLEKRLKIIINKFKNLYELTRNIADIIETITIAFNEEQYVVGGLRYISKMFYSQWPQIDLDKTFIKFLEYLDNEKLIRQKLNILLQHDLPYITIDQESQFLGEFSYSIALSQMRAHNINLNFAFIGGKRVNFKRVYTLAKIINKVKV